MRRSTHASLYLFVSALLVACGAPAAPPTHEALADAILAALVADDRDAFVALGPGSGDAELVRSLSPPQEVYDVSGRLEARFMQVRQSGSRVDWPALRRWRMLDEKTENQSAGERFGFVVREGERFHTCEVRAHRTERGLVMTSWDWDHDGGGDTFSKLVRSYEAIFALIEADPKDTTRVRQAIDAYLAKHSEELAILGKRHRAYVERLSEDNLMA